MGSNTPYDATVVVVLVPLVALLLFALESFWFRSPLGPTKEYKVTVPLARYLFCAQVQSTDAAQTAVA